MQEVTKRDGTRERYERRKVEESLRRAGAADNIIREMADKIMPQESESTTSFRSRIVAELRAKDPKAAERYENTRRLQAKRAEDVAEGSVRLHPTTARNMGCKSGDWLTVGFKDKQEKLHVEESNKAEARGSYFNNKTLQSLGATEGTKVSLSRMV